MAVSAFAKNPEDAYRVASYMQLPDVCITYVYDSNCGQDPYRWSSLKPEAAMKDHTGGPSLDAADAKSYVDAIREGLKAGYPELAIPGAPRYLDILDLYVSQALAGGVQAKGRARRDRARMGEHHRGGGSRPAKGGLRGVGQVVQGRRRQLLTLEA